MTTKSINIREEQEKWLEEKAINLSKFVRNKIDEEMEKWGATEE